MGRINNMKIAFNIKDMKPACYNLQAIYGGSSRLATKFPLHSWDLTPSDKISLYPINKEQLQFLIKKVEAKHGKD